MSHEGPTVRQLLGHFLTESEPYYDNNALDPLGQKVLSDRKSCRLIIICYKLHGEPQVALFSLFVQFYFWSHLVSLKINNNMVWSKQQVFLFIFRHKASKQLCYDLWEQN